MINEQRIFQAYYTKSKSIVNYMIDLLNLNGSEKIFEPCAGDGAFIDSIIDKNPSININAFELNRDAYHKLIKKYEKYDNISITQTDTLTDINLDLLCSMGGDYDAVIANPPYGAWRNSKQRALLKKQFNGLYAKESYSLFLYKSIQSLKENGKLVFIIPDTYLNLHMHKQIREYILTNTKIKEISLFPSSFFPDINFGYANLSIIALEKSSNSSYSLENTFNIYKNFNSVNELGKKELSHVTELTFKQKDIFNNSGHIFLTISNEKILECIKMAKNRIGDICHCVTGFYSGNDKERLKVLNKTIRNSKRYDEIDITKVTFDCSSRPVDGIETEKYYVPIVKGGNAKYIKSDNWFMEWSKEIVGFYKKDKKARYQNSAYYFKKGIAVPMISSSSITGSLIEHKLFDQSIVGVFPRDEKNINYLLAFFNSPTCNKLIRTINPSTNNSANYLKKIPFIKPNLKDFETISENIKKIIEQVKYSSSYENELENENNEIIKSIYGF